MKQTLKDAIGQIPEFEQDLVAQMLLSWLAMDENRWDSAFAGSADKLKKLRDEAHRAYYSGETNVLDPEKL